MAVGHLDDGADIDADPGDQHDEALGYRDEVVPPDAVDLAGWECFTSREHTTTHYYAKGPCPRCRATCQGHLPDASAPIEALGPGHDALPPGPPPESVEIPVSCTCGFDHGRNDATGCGRRWSIICPRQEP